MGQRKRRIGAFSLSFLDCICCGFGSIVLLLVLSKIYEPMVLDPGGQNLGELIATLRQELDEIRGETTVLNPELLSARQTAANAEMTIAELRRELDLVQRQYLLLPLEVPELQIDEGQLLAARQRLTEEMARLEPYVRRTPDDAVGGIPVDSEYIVFVIDTSGSMRAKWDFLTQKLKEVLNVYPTVQGLQIMNDNGTFMFPGHGRGWLRDTSQLRQAIRSTMQTWAPSSDSNPADGLIYALKTFSDPAK